MRAILTNRRPIVPRTPLTTDSSGRNRIRANSFEGTDRLADRNDPTAYPMVLRSLPGIELRDRSNATDNLPLSSPQTTLDLKLLLLQAGCVWLGRARKELNARPVRKARYSSNRPVPKYGNRTGHQRWLYGQVRTLGACGASVR